LIIDIKFAAQIDLFQNLKASRKTGFFQNRPVHDRPVYDRPVHSTPPSQQIIS